MTRPPLRIDSIPCKRLKRICREAGMTQSELSKRINISQQVLSRIMNEKANLTPQVAKRVILEFPQYRIEWLLGYSETMHELDNIDYVELNRLRALIETDVLLILDMFIDRKRKAGS